MLFVGDFVLFVQKQKRGSERIKPMEERCSKTEQLSWTGTSRHREAVKRGSALKYHGYRVYVLADHGELDAEVKI